jgi:hypothetical protein
VYRQKEDEGKEREGVIPNNNNNTTPHRSKNNPTVSFEKDAKRSNVCGTKKGA